jgi:hypothetical protein
MLARSAGITLLVARPHRLPPEAADDLRLLIELQGLDVLGVVALDAEHAPALLPRRVPVSA